MIKKTLFLLIVFSSLLSTAQNKQFRVSYISEPIKIDAILDEASWNSSKPATNFWQYFPSDSILAINQTEIRMLYNNSKLYVGIKIYSIGNDYIIPSLRRDFRASGSDNITLLFDTFNDGLNAYMFGSNPEGVLREALVSGGGNELRGFNSNWDTKWIGISKKYDGYYICEWEIPLSAFKFREGETRWRFNAYMFDTQGNERSTWNNIPRNQFIFNLAYMGDMIFERPLGNSKSPISLIPYINLMTGKDYEINESNSDFKAGGDAKFVIANSLNLDLTINPDFSQVEVDQQVTNLTRFEINLPEKRQFFIENSDLFADFGSSRHANPFFSRRIGIAKDTNDITIENDILGGVRLSGKLNNVFRIGFLNMQTTTDVENEIGANNNTVLALQHKVFSRSNISFLFVNRQNTSNEDFILPEEEYNRVLGLDYNLANKDNSWSGKFYAHKSFSPMIDSDDYSVGTRLQYNRANWRIQARALFIGENFNSDLGFIRRKDIIRIDPEIEYLLFPKKGFINQHTFSFTPVFVWQPQKDYKLADHNLISQWQAQLKNTGRMGATLSNRYTYLFDEFDPSLADGVPLPADTEYNYTFLRVEYRSDSRSPFFYEIYPTVGQFFNGYKYTLAGKLNLRLQPIFLFSIDARYDKIDLPKPYSNNDIWLVGPRVDITFSKSVFWATFIQYNSVQNNLGINSRLQWRFAPLSDLYLVYNDNYFTENVFAPRFRSINLKITYWLYL